MSARNATEAGKDSLPPVPSGKTISPPAHKTISPPV